MAALLLLRHGQIAANRQGRWHGSTDSPLTWRGRRQARRTARHVAREYPDLSAIYASPLSRCVTTAELIAARTGLPVEVRADLREYAIGAWENLPFRVLAAEHDFVNKATGDPDFAPPDGESLRSVARRTADALCAIDRAHPEPGRVLVVSHGACLAVALATLIDGSPAGWINYHFANCALTELVLSPTPYVNFFNSTRHL